MTGDNAVQEFLLACRADGLRPATLSWYRSILKKLVSRIPHAVDSITTKQLREHIVDLREQYSEHTAADHIRAMHRFFSWCAGEYSISNPMKGIRRPKMPAPVVRAIAASDFVRLFNATGEGDAGIRDRALLAFLADTGCRLGGVATLKLDNLDLEMRRAVVIEKGQTVRAIPFTFYTRELLYRWLSVRYSESRAVFTSMNNSEPLTTSGIQQILKRLKRKAKVTGRASPHSFRHAFAKAYLTSGGDLATLSKLLGHADVNTTIQFYAIFSRDELATLHDQHSPIADLLRKAANSK